VVIGAIGIVLILVGGRAVVNGTMTLGDLFAYMVFTGLMAAHIVQIASIGTQITEAFAGLDRIREILDTTREDAEDATRTPVGDLRGEIVFEDVWFEYRPGVPVLKGVSFTAPAGTTTALVGSSGSGKSTLISLVMAFNRPTQGVVRVDGRDLNALFARGAELVEMTGRHHADPVGGRRRAERQRPLHEARGLVTATTTAAHRHRRAALVALGARLPHGAEAEHVVGEPDRDGGAGVDHRAELGRQLDAARVPVEVEAKRVLELDDPRAREPGRDVHVAGVGREPVDVGEREPGVFYRRERRVDGELERVAVDPPADLRLAHAADDRLALEDLGR
jgi:energy-coupling factor transporter ATP-binding protein EcfA2